MPKNKRKGGAGRPTPPQFTEVRSEDDEVSSVMSVDSMGNTSVAESVNEMEDDLGGQANAETKLLDLVDLAGEKNVSTRVKGLEGIRKALQLHVFLFDADWSHRETLVDLLERSLKRGKSGEQVLAAMTLPLVVLQDEAGSLIDSDRLGEQLSLMRVLMIDASTAAPVRAACLSAFALLTFLRSNMMVAELEAAMRLLEAQFASSFLKGDGAAPRPSPAALEVHTAALRAWLLLAVVAHRSQFRRLHDEVLLRLPGLLSSASVELRISAGEAMALLFERFREVEEEDEEGAEEELEALLFIPNFPRVMEELGELAKDGAKNRAKADRRKQRSSFRDILTSVRDGEALGNDRAVRIGDQEEIGLSDWCSRRVYESLCDVVGGGMSRQLKDNPVVRHVFSLGPPILVPVGEKGAKGPNRHERRLANQAVAKMRNTKRAQHRDKRFVM